MEDEYEYKGYTILYNCHTGLFEWYDLDNNFVTYDTLAGMTAYIDENG